jgi:hypothetical protein
MAEYPEKKLDNVTVTMAASTKAKVSAFADKEGVSNARYCLDILERHFDKLESEATLTADLLGFQLLKK